MSPNVSLEKDVSLAIALASGKKVQQAADDAGVCRKTVQRKLAKPAFRRKVARLRQQFVGAALGRMADNMAGAADQLVELMTHQDPRLRLRAARTLIVMGLKLRDSVDLNDRIHDVEQELARKNGAGL
jgi:hypothetical protein